MNTNENYCSIGRIAGTHGLQGEVVLKHALGKTNMKGFTVFFIKEDGKYLPWFVNAVRVKNDDEIILKIDEIATPEAAKKILKKEVWLREEDFHKYAHKAAPITLLGFSILENNLSLGIIEEVIEQPHQILCKIFIHGKEVYIPLHEETLQGIDRKKKTVSVILPDGLLDVYLND